MVAALPDYCNDLNAMHEVEKTMAHSQTVYQYTVELDRITNRQEWHATAHQRAEAFLRTIGKWKD